MIRRSLPEGDFLIPQHVHALQAGRFAALLRDPPEPRDAFLRAVQLHDAGWALFDDEPTPLADGRAPHLFDEPLGFSLPAWRRTVSIARAVGATEALLVSRHFARLSPAFAEEQRGDWPAWRGAMGAATEARAVALLGLCDAVSLRLLCDPPQRVGFPDGFSWGATGLEPWPFAVERIEDTIFGRLLPRRQWTDHAEFAAVYTASPPHALQVRLEAGHA